MLRLALFRGLSRSRLGMPCNVLALIVCLALACSSNASVPVGSVAGIAVDDRGAPLPGITVSIQSQAGKLIDTVTTSEDGSYSFPSVPPGQYRVVSVFAGFSTPTPLNATVASGAATKVQPLVLVPPDRAEQGRLTIVTPTPAPK